MAQNAVCSNTPAEGERVERLEDGTSLDVIETLLEGVDDDVGGATMVNTHAVSARHAGTGDIDVVRSMIDTSGMHQACAIFGEHAGTVTVDASASSAKISKTGRTGHGVHGRLSAAGHIRLNVGFSRINTKENDARGIHAVHDHDLGEFAADPDVAVTATANDIVKEGQRAHGIRGSSKGACGVTIITTSNAVTTKGRHAIGAFGYRRATATFPFSPGGLSGGSATARPRGKGMAPPVGAHRCARADSRRRPRRAFPQTRRPQCGPQGPDWPKKHPNCYK